MSNPEIAKKLAERGLASEGDGQQELRLECLRLACAVAPDGTSPAELILQAKELQRYIEGG